MGDSSGNPRFTFDWTAFDWSEYHPEYAPEEISLLLPESFLKANAIAIDRGTMQGTMHLPTALTVETPLEILWQRLRWAPLQVPRNRCMSIAVLGRKRKMLSRQAVRLPDPNMWVTEQIHTRSYNG